MANEEDGLLRKKFEAWATDHKFNLRRDETVIDLEEGGTIYANPMTQGCWMAWCGAVKEICQQLEDAGYLPPLPEVSFQ